MRLLAALLWSTLAAVTSASLCVCPAEFSPLGTDGCYHLVADGDFESVQVACQSRGGELMRVTGPKEDEEVRSVMNKHWLAMVWIGLRDEGTDGKPEWRWSDGSALSYSDWHREPGTGRCVVSWLYGGWQRQDCHLPAPGLCVHPVTQPQPCADSDDTQSHLSGSDDKWKLAPPPTEAPLPPLEWLPEWTRRSYVLRDAQVQWHHWL